MKLLAIRKAVRAGDIPFSEGTLHNWHIKKRYPGLILKLGGKLFWDEDQWDDIAKKEKERQIEEASSGKKVK